MLTFYLTNSVNFNVAPQTRGSDSTPQILTLVLRTV